MQRHSIQFYDKINGKKIANEGAVFMPWECKTVEKQRLEFVTKALETNNFSALCREYEITRKTGRKWVDRFKQGLPLTDMSRRPLCSPNKTPDDIEELIVSVRFDNPGWGDDKIKIFLENQGYKNIPCPRTITNILHKHQLISEEESLKRKPFKRFQKEHCNDMWQTDFKGEFLTADNRYCYPLTILDDSSRYSIKIACFPNTKNVVINAFKQAFYEFGMPSSVLSDNGSQFAGFKHGFTMFEKFLMNNDILPIHCRIKHPQTQGKIERFHVCEGISANCKSQIMFNTSVNKFIYFAFCINALVVAYPHSLASVRLVCFVLFLVVAENLLHNSFNGGFL